MILDDFWQLIDTTAKAANGDRALQCRLLEEELGEETSDTIRSYALILMDLLQKGCTYELWASYYLLNGGYEEWGFEDFRFWLIAKGKAFWNATLAAPASFLEQNVHFKDGDNPEVTFYEFWAVFKKLYEAKSGHELYNNIDWLRKYELVQNAEYKLEKEIRPKTEQLRKEYPALYEKFFSRYYDLLKRYQQLKED